jgi:hypothetical protein
VTSRAAKTLATSLSITRTAGLLVLLLVVVSTATACGGSRTATRTVTVTVPSFGGQGQHTTTAIAAAPATGAARVVVEKSAIFSDGKTGHDFIYGVGLVLRNPSSQDARHVTVTVDLVDRGKLVIASHESLITLVPAGGTTYFNDTLFTPARQRPSSLEVTAEVAESTAAGARRPTLSHVAFKYDGPNSRVTGVLTNTLDYAVNGHVSAVLFDSDGRMVGGGEGGAEADEVAPGRKSLFTVSYMHLAPGASGAVTVKATAGARASRDLIPLDVAQLGW